MPPRRIIGIDAGGTKLLGGVVDEGLAVGQRVHRTWDGADREETLDIAARAVQELLAQAPDAEAVGFGIPSLVEWESGVSVWSNHLPIADEPFRELMTERLGLAGIRGQRREHGCHRRAPSRCGPRRRSRGDAGVGHGHRRGARARRPAVPRGTRIRRRAGPHRGGPRRRGLPRRMSRPRLPRGARVREGDRQGGGAGCPRVPGVVTRRCAETRRRGLGLRSSPSWRCRATRERSPCSTRSGGGLAPG